MSTPAVLKLTIEDTIKLAPIAPFNLPPNYFEDTNTDRNNIHVCKDCEFRTLYETIFYCNGLNVRDTNVIGIRHYDTTDPIFTPLFGGESVKIAGWKDKDGNFYTKYINITGNSVWEVILEKPTEGN